MIENWGYSRGIVCGSVWFYILVKQSTNQHSGEFLRLILLKSSQRTLVET